jgi:ABC-type uncharacterized transport system auxiliary subunit
MYYKTKMFSLCVSVFFLAGGCVNFKQPRNRVQHYTLEYASPEIPELVPLPVSLKVMRFSVAPAYNTNRIMYRDGSFKRNEYFYHKWRANPGDMVTDFLRRDIRNSGLFKAVLPPGSDFPFSCALEGSVDEFVEWDTPEGWKAVLSVTITLIASNEPDVSKRILFQKTYRAEKPFQEKNPQGLSQAMSLAMGDISSSVIRDIYSVLAN